MIKLSWTVVLSLGEVQIFLKLNSRPQHPLSGRDVTLVTEREGWGLIPNHIPDEGGYRYVFFLQRVHPLTRICSFRTAQTQLLPLPQGARVV